MAEQPGAGRLDPETLAAYVDGLLPPEERAKVEAEIVADPESYEWLVNSINAVDDGTIAATANVPLHEPAPVSADETVSSPPPQSTDHAKPAGDGEGPRGRVLPFYRRRGVQGVIGTLVAAAAALVLVVRTQPVWWQDIWGPAVDPRFAKLVEAVGEERYIEARLTGGFKYGPLRQVMRGVDDSSEILGILGAAAELERQAERTNDATSRHVAGVASVLAGGEHLGRGIRAMEAAEATLDSPRLQSDLGAAYLERFRWAGNLTDLSRAIAQCNRALLAEPQMPEALYNRALALQLAGQGNEAASAWSAYVALAPQDAWSEEAKRHLTDLRGHVGPATSPNASDGSPARPGQ